MSLKLVIFDLDGTLVDTSEDITNALNHAVTPYGLKPLGVQDAIGMIGEGLSRLVERMLGEENARLKDDVLKMFLEHYSAHLTDCSRVYPRVRETLAALHGLKKAVISNKRESLSKRLLTELGISGYFDMVVGSDTTPEKKPSSLPVLHVLSTLGVRAPEAVMVGDSSYDIEAAKKSGVKSVAVTYGYRRVELLGGADFLLDDIAGLTGLLKKITG